MSMYSTESTQSSWALLGLAVRICQGLGMHRDGDGSSWDPFHAEMRRRLWWQLIALDVLLSNDRGTQPLISAKSFTTRKPLHIDDEEINHFSQNSIQERSELVGMTLPLVYMDGLNVLRDINLTQTSTQARADLANAFSERMEDSYLQHSDHGDSYIELADTRTWLVYMSGQLL